jgi:peptide/nickel transport system ATP-binding protein
MATGRELIALRDLSIAFGSGAEKHVAVSNVNLSVVAGQSFGLVGESGSGKTTLLRSIAGLGPKPTGDVVIDGVTLVGRRDSAMRKRIQFVFQDPYASLHPSHTIYRIISEPLVINKVARPDERVQRVLRDVGLPENVSYRYPHQLSGGQRQRVAIARAAVMEPDILLLDEPTSALDASVQAEVLNLLSDLRASRAMTVILVSHDLAVVNHFCDRVAVMRGGQIVEVLSTEAIARESAGHPYTIELIDRFMALERRL